MRVSRGLSPAFSIAMLFSCERFLSLLQRLDRDIRYRDAVLHAKPGHNTSISQSIWHMVQSRKLAKRFSNRDTR